MRKSLTTALASVFAVAALAGPAAAAPQNQQNGLVNVAVFDVTVIDGNVVLVLNRILSDNNVNVGVAAQIAANICGVKVGPVAVLGAAVDASGETATVCGNAQEIGDQVVTLTN